MKVFVLDDDPTGTQTVHDVPVLTVWDVETLAGERDDSAPACFVLTNSRALPESEAVRLGREIGRNLMAAGAQTGKAFAVVSRSDSTLRGHFPAEVDALAEGLGMADVPILLCPYFEAGGRVTIDDIHYVRTGETLVPAGETEFARDATFGYRASNLRDWVVEKSGGRIAREQVESVTLETIRQGGEAAVAGRLAALAPRCRVIVVNAERPSDVETFVAGLHLAESAGARFLYRSAASFAAARAGIAPRAPLTAGELSLPSGGTLTVVGSYVDRTTVQLRALLDRGGAVPVEVSVPALLDDEKREGEIRQGAATVNDALAREENVVLFTSRERVQAGALDAGSRISEALVQIVRRLAVRPRALIAKGGITSSDVATKALGIRRAWVLGQIAPGVPVWKTGAESRWPEMIYVVFPGNVGAAETLADVVSTLSC